MEPQPTLLDSSTPGYTRKDWLVIGLIITYFLLDIIFLAALVFLGPLLFIPIFIAFFVTRITLIIIFIIIYLKWPTQPPNHHKPP